MPDFEVSSWDIGILVVYVLGTRIALGWWATRGVRDGAESYFLAGRKMTWPIIGLSFFVSNMSGSSFVGLASSGYADGVAVYNYEWVPGLILVFFAWFVLPLYLGSKVYTAPQYLEHRFGTRTKLAFSGFLLFANVFIDAAAALYAGAMVGQALFPQIPLTVTIWLTAVVAGIYIFFGGLRAVVLNDVIQAVLILVGGAAIALIAFFRLESWSAVRSAVAPEQLSLFRSASDDVLPWPGIFTGVMVVGIYFWCTNQFVIQRALGARTLDHARKGVLLAGLLKLPNLFILVLPGVMARVLYPDLDNPDLAFPTLAFDMLPFGLRGVMLAALVAAILSSLEAILNSASTLVTMDFVRNVWPRTGDARLVTIGRVSTLLVMVVSASWAPQIAEFPSLWRYLQSILAYLTPPVVAVFLLGFFWRRATAFAAELVLAAMLPIGLVGWLINEVAALTNVQFLYVSGGLFATSLVVAVVTSLCRPVSEGRPVADVLVWSPALWRRESEGLANVPRFRDPRVLTVGLIVPTLALVIWWA